MSNSQFPQIIAITACPTGIAHTYMAKEKIEQAAKQLNMTYKVETQGRSGDQNVLTAAEIANAEIIIFAADKAVNNRQRFNGKKVLEVSTREAIFKAENVIKSYHDSKTKLTMINDSTSSEQSTNRNKTTPEFSLKNFRFVTRNLLNGVSYMLPFVVAGGIILGIGFLLDSGYTGANFGFNRPVAAWFSGLGQLIFSMMIPILGGYICYAIVGIQGLLPGIICGLIANAPDLLYSNNSKNAWGQFFPAIKNFNSGFFGAIVGSYLAAFVVYYLAKWMYRLPKPIQGVRDIVFIPVLSALAAGVIMFAINIPLGYLNYGLGLGLKAMANARLGVIAGLIIGMMMAVDMGGPINKAAYIFGTITIKASDPIYKPLQASNNGTIFMAASMIAGMVPPLAIALSTRIFHKYWTKQDIAGGNTNWFLSACFITEGAIPYAAADPKRVIPSCMVGSGVTGAIIAGFGVTLSAPHGGIFVFPLIRIQDNGTNWFQMSSVGSSLGVGIVIAFLALIIGAITTATMLGVWRRHDIKHQKLILT